MRRLIREKLISSAHDLSDGGLAVALAESCLGGNQGASIKLPPAADAAQTLFGEGPSRVIITFSQESLARVKQLAAEASVELVELGKVGGESLKISLGEDLVVNLCIPEMRKVHEEVFSCIME